MTSRAVLVEMIAKARRVVAFTGAGLSTDSGIADFRSPGGVWTRMQPIQFGEFLHDESLRREAWRRAFTGAAGWTGAQPNSGHYALARMAAAGKVTTIITQNVDNLQQASGVVDGQLVELHGNASYAACMACETRHELDVLRGPFEVDGVIPQCRECGALVKVATISFGQPMPKGPMAAAVAASLDCDLFLVLGSSLVVAPAATLPQIARRNGASLVIVNRQATPQDHSADLVLHDEISAVLAEVSPSAD